MFPKFALEGLVGETSALGRASAWSPDISKNMLQDFGMSTSPLSKHIPFAYVVNICTRNIVSSLAFSTYRNQFLLKTFLRWFLRGHRCMCLGEFSAAPFCVFSSLLWHLKLGNVTPLTDHVFFAVQNRSSANWRYRECVSLSGSAINPMSMADSANVTAVVSTSRRKRVLPSQPHTEAKRPRSSSEEDHSPETRQKTSKVILKTLHFHLKLHLTSSFSTTIKFIE